MPSRVKLYNNLILKSKMRILGSWTREKYYIFGMYNIIIVQNRNIYAGGIHIRLNRNHARRSRKNENENLFCDKIVRQISSMTFPCNNFDGRMSGFLRK